MTPRSSVPSGLFEKVRALGPRLLGVLDELNHNLWLIPGVAVGGAVALSMCLVAVDGRLAADATGWYLFRGGPEGARALLTSVASSIMTVTGVVFSVTVLVLQLASQQFSPRVLRTFLGDRATQASLGVFVGTFVYALLTLRSVRGASHGVAEFVPSLSVWVAVALAAASIGMFVYFIHHVSQSIRAVNVLGRLGAETRAALTRMYPESVGEDAEPVDAQRPPGEPSLLVLHEGRSGVITAAAESRLWEAATAADVAVALRPMIGDFVPQGGVLFEVWGDATRVNAKELAAAVAVGRERTLRQDPAFGFRGIVDIAERALSPSTNDPTTAVQALDQLHDLLRNLALRRFPAPACTDRTGRLRVILPRPDFDSYVRLSLDEIRYYGAGSVQIVRRLRFLLEDLLAVAPPSRRGELRRQLRALDDKLSDGVTESTSAPAILRQASAQGHGP